MSAAITAVEEALAQAGCNPVWANGSLTAKCPAHPDRTPSLSIKEGTTQPVVLHCFAGCTPAAIIQTLNLSWADLCNDKPTPNPVCDVYDYRDATGQLTYQVLRYANKQFRQRQPDHTTGEWIWNIRGVTPLPYRLPELIEATINDETIWIVEGEKDVEYMRKAGHTATCNSGGAGKWTDEHSRWLQGANVAIIADRDTPGIQHAETVQTSLATIGVIAPIYQPATGKDATDHLLAGHTLDQLTPLTTEQLTNPEETHPLEPWLIDWDTMWASEYEPEWLLEPIFAKGRSHALYAAAKSGKSYVILAACAALATGQSFCGSEPQPPKHVLYVDYEMSMEDIRDRLEEFGYGPTDDLTYLHYALLPSLPPLDTPEGGQALLASALAINAELVIIDTTSRAIIGEENSADTMRAFYRSTGLPLKQHGITWERLDHAGKELSRGQRGSSGKADDVDVVIRLEKTDDGAKLVATHRRMSWYPETTAITITKATDGTSVFQGTAHTYPTGTKRLAAQLDAINVPATASKQAARKAMNEWNHDHPTDEIHGASDLLGATIRWRKQEHQRRQAEEAMNQLRGNRT